jgi:hypothetical protein
MPRFLGTRGPSPEAPTLHHLVRVGPRQRAQAGMILAYFWDSLVRRSLERRTSMVTRCRTRQHASQTSPVHWSHAPRRPRAASWHAPAATRLPRHDCQMGRQVLAALRTVTYPRPVLAGWDMDGCGRGCPPCNEATARGLPAWVLEGTVPWSPDDAEGQRVPGRPRRARRAGGRP